MWVHNFIKSSKKETNKIEIEQHSGNKRKFQRASDLLYNILSLLCSLKGDEIKMGTVLYQTQFRQISWFFSLEFDADLYPNRFTVNTRLSPLLF